MCTVDMAWSYGNKGHSPYGLGGNWGQSFPQVSYWCLWTTGHLVQDKNLLLDFFFFFTAWDCSVTSWPSKAALQRTLGAIFWVEEYATDEALITEVQNRTKATDSKQLHSRKLVFIASSLWSREMVKLKGLRDKIRISAVYKKLTFKNIGTTWEWNDGKECFRQMRLGSKQV